MDLYLEALPNERLFCFSFSGRSEAFPGLLGAASKNRFYCCPSPWGHAAHPALQQAHSYTTTHKGVAFALGTGWNETSSLRTGIIALHK